MEWLVGLSVRTVLVVVGVLLIGRARVARARRLPELLGATLVECSEIAVVSVVIVFLILHRFLFQLFYIPSESMIPTLAVRDQIVVNRCVYRVHPPRRGDVVVFHAPPAASEQPCDFIKRVVGLPGETVSVVPDTICLDGRPLAPVIMTSEAKSARDGLLIGDEAKVRVQPDRVLVDGQPVLIASADGQARRLGPAIIVDGRVVEAVKPGETLRCRPLRADRDGIQAEGTVVWSTARPRLTVVKGRRLSLQRGYVCVNGRPLPELYSRESPRYAMAAFHLAAGQYLVLGDNRNNSKDSHFWGALDGSRIIGRAEAIYWPRQRAQWLGDGRALTYAGM